jgi:isopropylmalate/homocitrate/citramalate synthase
MKPVCGRWACSHESGIHVRGTLTEPLAFQPFDGKSAGRESTELLLGKHSGKSAVIRVLQKNGITPTEVAVQRLLAIIKDASLDKKKLFLEKELLFDFKQLSLQSY